MADLDQADPVIGLGGRRSAREFRERRWTVSGRTTNTTYPALTPLAGHHVLRLLLGLLATVVIGAGPSVASDAAQHLQRGRAAKAEGKWGVAEAEFREAVEAVGKEQETRLDQAAAYHALASHLHDCGRYSDAVNAYSEALRRLAGVYGEKSIPYASCLNNIGQALSDLGRYKEAREKLGRSVAIVRDLNLGPNPTEVLNLNALAVLCRREGKYDEAVRLYSDALGLAKQLPAVDPVFLAAAVLNLGVAFSEKGELERAEGLFGECSALLAENRLTKTVPYAAYLHALARLKLRQKDTAEARRCAEKAVEVCKQVLGDKHPRTATSMEVLAEVLLAAGEFAEAESLLAEVLAVREAALGANSPYVAETFANKAKAARSLKKPGEAVAAFKKSHDILLATFEKHIPANYKWVVEDYAELLRAEGRAEDAQRVSATTDPR